MKFGAPRAAASLPPARGPALLLFSSRCPARAPAPVPRSGGAARAPRGAGCKRRLAPAGLLLPAGPPPPARGHCPRAPAAAPPPPAAATPARDLARPKVLAEGAECPARRGGRRRRRARGAPSGFLKSTLPAAAAAAAAAPAAESSGLQPAARKSLPCGAPTERGVHCVTVYAA
ncbi:atherin-like [Vulpes lagopus]|uniref:atherin-like n=1 Tax=Vulpes lagopus TaxID=494514 RepID=UPI001BC98B06|nr:atherin-like [Vulpes lagopus]